MATPRKGPSRAAPPIPTSRPTRAAPPVPGSGPTRAAPAPPVKADNSARPLNESVTISAVPIRPVAEVPKVEAPPPAVSMSPTSPPPTRSPDPNPRFVSPVIPGNVLAQARVKPAGSRSLVFKQPNSASPTPEPESNKELRGLIELVAGRFCFPLFSPQTASFVSFSSRYATINDCRQLLVQSAMDASGSAL